VHDAVLVRRREAAQDLSHHVDGELEGKHGLSPQQGFERLAVEQLHHHEQQAVAGAPEVEDVDDVWVTDGARGSRLALETGSELGVGAGALDEGLDRHAPAERDVQRLVDDAHRAPPELAPYLVFAFEQLAWGEGGPRGRDGPARERAVLGFSRVLAAAVRARHGPRVTAECRPVSNVAPAGPVLKDRQ